MNHVNCPNDRLVRGILELLRKTGLSEFCVCPGARNAPFVVRLNPSSGFTVHHFFEERSSAFFALGRIERSRNPVAVVTTSGTAAAELLPAAIEATYLSKPLVLVTADRPHRFRGTGAPQSINQTDLFSCYVEKNFDIEHQEELQNAALWIEKKWTRQAPLHLNVCFDEPLLDGPPDHLPVDLDSKHGKDPKELVQESPLASSMDLKVTPSQVYLLEEPVVIVGALAEENRTAVVKALLKWRIPVYIEALSNLTGQKNISEFCLRGGEKSLSKAFQNGWARSMIRIGGIPTARVWRDLESKLIDIPVFSISDSPLTGLSKNPKRFHQHLLGFGSLSSIKVQSTHGQAIFQNDRERTEKLEALFFQYPQSEPGLFYFLSKKLEGQSIYLGNSMPIRQWDLCASKELCFQRFFAHRGANGIDGQVSSFLGWAHGETENWALLGDLTVLYDLSALWMTEAVSKQEKGGKSERAKLRIVIVNNGGGQIFKNLFHDERFLNRHSIHFEKWAEMFRWSYRAWKQIPNSDMGHLGDREVIELLPCEVDTDSFWREYQNL